MKFVNEKPDINESQGQRRYILNYWFDYGGGMLWAEPSDEYTQTKYFSYTAPEQLPISETLVDKLYSLEDEFQESLNWDYPPDPSSWSKEQFRDFVWRARIVLKQLQDELGNGYEIRDKTNTHLRVD